jgi:acyl-coenzyme A synthetase/AMP-(fatty) acid ligase
LLPKDIEAKLGSIGKGIPGVELSVVDDHGVPVQPGETGEIVARGDNVMMGYWKDPEATGGVLRADGLHTGDLARVDEDGYIFVVGRRSDMIKSGAYRINPQEIEEVIAELDEVAEVAVVGCPDELMGESIVAFVIVSRDVGQDLEETILQHCRRGLPRHKHVRHVRFVPTLPRTSSGKVKRQELREAFSTD